MTILYFILLMLIGNTLSNSGAVLQEVGIERHHRNQHSAVIALASEVESFQRKYFRYPDDLNELAGTNGHEGVRLILSRVPNIIYAVETLDDGAIEYQRVLLAKQSSSDPRSESSYLSDNQCGGASFDEGDDFCPDDSATFHISDNRQRFLKSRSNATQRLDSVLSAFVRAYDGGFSDLGGTVSAGDSAYLKSGVGFSGNANSCTGVRTVDDVVLTCRHLFSQSGAEIGYIYLGPNHIMVETALPFSDASGSPIKVLREVIL